MILSPVCGHLFVFHRSPADCSENGGFLDMAAGHRLSFSEGDCTGSLGWPYRVHRTADTTCSVVVCTSRREGMGLLRSPLHEAVLRRHFTNHKHPLYALDRRTG